MKQTLANDVLLRPANPAELPALEPLYETWASAIFAPLRDAIATHRHALPECLRHPLKLISPESPEHRCVVAEDRHCIVGLVATCPTTGLVETGAASNGDTVLSAFLDMTPRDSLHIGGLAVLPRYRRRGIAARLIATAGIEAQTLGLPRLSVTLFQAAETARLFFAAAGFVEVARHPPPSGGAQRHLGDVCLLERAVPA